MFSLTVSVSVSMSTKLGTLRVYPVRCAAVVNEQRCSALTLNPNCFCGSHQKLTKVPRFQQVHTSEVLLPESDINFDHGRVLEQDEVAVIQLAIKAELLQLLRLEQALDESS